MSAGRRRGIGNRKLSAGQQAQLHRAMRLKKSLSDKMLLRRFGSLQAKRAQQPWVQSIIRRSRYIRRALSNRNLAKRFRISTYTVSRYNRRFIEEQVLLNQRRIRLPSPEMRV